MFYKSTKNKLAAAVLKKDLGIMKKSMDVNEVGGTALVGISKPVIKAHGSSNAACIFAAVRQAMTFGRCRGHRRYQGQYRIYETEG